MFKNKIVNPINKKNTYFYNIFQKLINAIYAFLNYGLDINRPKNNKYVFGHIGNNGIGFAINEDLTTFSNLKDDASTYIILKDKDLELGSNDGKVNIFSDKSFAIFSNSKIIIDGNGVEINKSNSNNITFGVKDIKFIGNNNNILRLKDTTDVQFNSRDFRVVTLNRQNSIILRDRAFEVETYNAELTVKNTLISTPSENGFKYYRGDALYEDSQNPELITGYTKEEIFRIEDNGDIYIMIDGSLCRLQDYL